MNFWLKISRQYWPVPNNDISIFEENIVFYLQLDTTTETTYSTKNKGSDATQQNKNTASPGG